MSTQPTPDQPVADTPAAPPAPAPAPTAPTDPTATTAPTTAAPATTAAPDSGQQLADMRAEIQRLQAELAQDRQQLADQAAAAADPPPAPAPAPAPPAAAPVAPVAPVAADPTPAPAAPTAVAAGPAAVQAPSFDGWPTKGYDGPQPWDLVALGLKAEAQALADAGDGAPNTVSPIVVRPGLPMLVEGSQGDAVRELAVCLAELGYATTVSRGENPYNVLDGSISEAVASFRRDYGVDEDPSAFTRDPRNNAISHIGPWTQEALIRASEREAR